MDFNCVLVKVSPEISLKTRFVRKYFSDKLCSNIKTVLRANGVSGTKIVKGNGRLFIFPDKQENLSKIFGLLFFVFGVHSRAMAFSFEFKDKDKLVANSVLFAQKFFSKGTFKVDARREKFEEMSSKQLEELIGSKILEKMPFLKVKLEKPKNTLFLEVVKNKAFLYNVALSGQGGLPLGCEGNVCVFFEGKKEDLASAFLMMKRGCNVFPVAEKFDKKLKQQLNRLSRWNSFRQFRLTFLNDVSFLKEKADISVKAIVFSQKKFSKKMVLQKKLFGPAVFWPLAFLPQNEVKKITGLVEND